MTSLTNLPSVHHRHEPSTSSSDTAELESHLIGLMVSPDTLGRADGVHGSKFIECMDYSITSFQAGLCDKRRPSKITAVLPPSPPSRRSSRGFGGLIRMLSLKNTAKRDVSPNSTTTQLLQLKPELPNANSSKLGRRISQKPRRTSTPLVIETGKTLSWTAGLKNKTFTPFFQLSSSPSPISLSSSTSGCSGESSVASNPISESYLLNGPLLGTPRSQRSISMSEIENHQPILPPSIPDSPEQHLPFSEPSSQSSSTRKSFSLHPRDTSHIRSPPLILSKLPQVKKKTARKTT